MKGQTCCFTGHRELDEDEGEIKNRLCAIIRLLIAKNIIYYISGAAKGFDLLAAETVLELRKEFPQIRLILEIPCRNQSQGWGTSTGNAIGRSCKVRMKYKFFQNIISADVCRNETG